MPNLCRRLIASLKPKFVFYGFLGRSLTFDEKNELVAAACHQYVHRVIRAGEYLNQSR